MQLSLLVLKTHQVEALRSFYEAIGLAFVEEQHGSGPVHYAAELGATVVELYPLPADAEPDATTRLGFTVADVARVQRALADLNLPAKPPKQTEWGLRVVVKDPDGRSVELWEGEPSLDAE